MTVIAYRSFIARSPSGPAKLDPALKDVRQKLLDVPSRQVLACAASRHHHFHHRIRLQRRHRGAHSEASTITHWHDGARTVALAIHNASAFGHGIIATIVSLAVLSLGATCVFSELHTAMNKIWKVRRRQYGFIVGRAQGQVCRLHHGFGHCFLLLISMIISAVLAALTAYFSYVLPGADFLWHIADLVVSFGVVTLLFALLFRYVPDERVTWKDVWIGAAATAILFDLGKFLIGFYIGQTSVGSMFGAAGSVVVILAWVYYSSQLVFLGAEFTHVYAKHHGSKSIAPEERPAA
jgi:membrane protein